MESPGVRCPGAQVLVEAAAGEKGALPSRRDANMVVSGSPKASH